MIHQTQAAIGTERARTSIRGLVPGHGTDPGQGAHVLLLCRDRLASLVIAQSLPPRIRSTHAEAAEEAFHRGRLAEYSVAFVDCDMPDCVFRKLHDLGHTARGGIRVIGLRGHNPWRPMRLLAERMISSYVRMPVPMKVMRLLFEHPPGQRAMQA